LRISWYSNSPWAPTGYGTQTAQVVKRLVADGHDVAVLANFGLMGTILEWEGATVYPGGSTPQSLDVVEDQHKAHRGDQVITLYDVWTFPKDLWQDQPVASWVPIDSSPVAPQIVPWVQKHKTIAMSKFGQRELAGVGVESTYIPHALDLDVYKPTESDFRQAMRIPADAFLVTINAQNQTTAPDRKSWFEMLAALSVFMRSHDDAFVYLHTHLTRPTGVPLPYWMRMLDMPMDRVRAVEQTGYQSTGISNEQMAAVYTMTDVLLATSKGEGFGLPVIEAQACGTPVIVTDFSAQPELVGAGWKVKYQPMAYYPMGNFLATPSIPSIIKALEDAYTTRGSEELKAQALAKAQEYDADKVYAEMWRPYIASLEADLQPRVKQFNPKNKAAKRRQKRAA
jgi:glycosyltransferase involved in cell wall biosynthesis